MRDTIIEIVLAVVVVGLAAVCAILLRKLKKRRAVDPIGVSCFSSSIMGGGSSFFYEYYKTEVTRALNFTRNNPNEETKHFFAVAALQLHSPADAFTGASAGDRSTFWRRVVAVVRDALFSRDLTLFNEPEGEILVIFTNTASHGGVERKISVLKKKIEEIGSYTTGGTGVFSVSTGLAFFEDDFIMGRQDSVIKAARDRAAAR